MLAIRLPQSIEKRLDRLAKRIGRTKTFYVREAIREHLEDPGSLGEALHGSRLGEFWKYRVGN